MQGRTTEATYGGTWVPGYYKYCGYIELHNQVIFSWCDRSSDTHIPAHPRTQILTNKWSSISKMTFNKAKSAKASRGEGTNSWWPRLSKEQVVRAFLLTYIVEWHGGYLFERSFFVLEATSRKIEIKRSRLVLGKSKGTDETLGNGFLYCKCPAKIECPAFWGWYQIDRVDIEGMLFE